MVSRFDINLAPLDQTSRFCAAKSELKFFEAGAVGVPTVASPTPPMQAVIQQAHNGFTAATTDEWIGQLSDLIHYPSKRKRIASRAFRTVRRQFSPRAQRRDLQRLLGEGLID